MCLLTISPLDLSMVSAGVDQGDHLTLILDNISTASFPVKYWHHLLRLYCDLGDDNVPHWGWVKNVCLGDLTIIGSDNGLSPGRRQAIIWTNAGILLIGPLGTNFSEILIKIVWFLFKKMHLKMLPVKWQPFFLGLSVFLCWSCDISIELGWYRGCWCPGYFIHKISSSRVIGVID